MSKMEEIRKFLSAYIGKTGASMHVPERERRTLIIAGTFLLVAVSIILLAVSSIRPSSGISGCTSIILQAQRNGCLSNLANKTGNYSACLLIRPSGYSYQCISDVAKKSGDINTCSEISGNISYYTSCVEQISYAQSNPQYCKLLTSDNESECAYSIAESEMFGNLSYCNEIMNSSLGMRCTSMHYYNIAVDSKNPSYCSMLPNAIENGTLSEMLSEDNPNVASDAQLLAYSYLNITPSGLCYYELASVLSNQSICGDVTGPLSQICYEQSNASISTGLANANTINYTIYNGNVSALCAGAPSYATSLCQYSLITERAIEARNAISCYAISNAGYQYSCILSIAARYNDSSYCSYINNNSTAENACNESIIGIIIPNSTSKS